MTLHHSSCRQANFRIDLKEVDVEEIYADKRQIEQVLLNMINNACEAIEKKGGGGMIFISVKKKGSNIMIGIRDNGIGIAGEDKAKIFDPFFTTTAPRGTGLGLSVSYGIVERHGGRIDFESEPDLGTTFRIYLPLEKENKDAIPT